MNKQTHFAGALAAVLLCVLLAGCGSAGADGYYNDTNTPDHTAQANPPTPQLTTPAHPPDTYNTITGVGDDYALGIAITLVLLIGSPFIVFLFASTTGRAFIRRASNG